jgi:hypothetical protein
LSCPDAVRLLGDYPDLALQPTDVVRLVLHLGACRPCRGYLGTCRTTALLLRDSAVDIRMPEAAKQRLRAYLVQRLSTESRQ